MLQDDEVPEKGSLFEILDEHLTFDETDRTVWRIWGAILVPTFVGWQVLA